MKYNELVKDYYGNVSNLTQLLKSLVDSYRLLIAGAAEMNNINEAKTSQVKDAVHRADKLGETIDELIEILGRCGEGYFHYCDVVGNYILKKGDSNVILTEVDNDLLFQDSSVLRQDIEDLKNYKDTKN